MSFQNVLDVGCSDGFFSKYFIENLNASKVTGLDINKYDGSIAFEVLKNYEEDFDLNTITIMTELLKESYENLGLVDANKFLLIKKYMI